MLGSQLENAEILRQWAMGAIRLRNVRHKVVADSIHPLVAVTQDAGKTMPIVSPQLLESVFSSLAKDDIKIALQQGLVPVAWLPYQIFYAQCEGFAPSSNHQIVAKAEPTQFNDVVQKVLSRRLARQAAFGLAANIPIFSARRRFTLAQGVSFGLAALVLLASLAVMPASFNHHMLGILFSVFFSTMIWLRVMALNEPYAHRRQEPERDDAKLPVYSILVPLFRETAVLPQLIAALGSIHYPTEKLDIKLIIEEKDLAMRQAIAAIKFPRHFQILVVPSGRPQTKPRALNYALNFARGSLVTIYDAEDIPEPMQLRMAVKAFADLPKSIACLQAELGFYNPNENWLTRQFTIEYAVLFKLILPGLAADFLPLPLGGTSNHFRKDVLQAVGGWDPHNVTEDADLGFRLARLGYHTSTLDSTTYEEANTALRNWLQQRARWFKGFLQTWLVHMRRPLALVEEVGVAGFMTLQASVLGVVISAALYPLFLASTVYHIASAAFQKDAMTFAFASLAEAFYIGLFVLGLTVMIYSGAVALKRKGIIGWWLALASMPVYWLLASFAAWIAIWQFAFNPFHWNKTRHGLSRFVLRPRTNTPISRAEP